MAIFFPEHKWSISNYGTPHHIIYYFIFDVFWSSPYGTFHTQVEVIHQIHIVPLRRKITCCQREEIQLFLKQVGTSGIDRKSYTETCKNITTTILWTTSKGKKKKRQEQGGKWLSTPGVFYLKNWGPLTVLHWFCLLLFPGDNHALCFQLEVVRWYMC